MIGQVDVVRRRTEWPVEREAAARRTGDPVAHDHARPAHEHHLPPVRQCATRIGPIVRQLAPPELSVIAPAVAWRGRKAGPRERARGNGERRAVDDETGMGRFRPGVISSRTGNGVPGASRIDDDVRRSARNLDMTEVRVRVARPSPP